MTLVLDGTPYADHGTLVVESQDNSFQYNWRNTIDLVWASGDAPAYGDAVISAFVNFLKGLQRDDCTIRKVTLLPYVKGRQPLADQGAIWEQITSIACKNWGTGTIFPSSGSSQSPVVGELCVMLTKGKFAGGGGRVGRMFLRNAVAQENLANIPGGPPQFASGVEATYSAAMNTWATDNLGDFSTDSALPRFCLIHAQKLTQTPAAHDIFDSAMAVPTYTRLTMHDITSKSRR